MARKPYWNLEHEATLAVLRAQADLSHRIEGLFEPQGIGGEQYNVLRILRGAGPEGLPTLEIAARMIHQTPGITRLLDRLEKKRLVRRCRGAEDRRQVLCRITPQGLDLLAQLDTPLDGLQKEFFAGLDDAALRQLIDLLARLKGRTEKGETR